MDKETFKRMFKNAVNNLNTKNEIQISYSKLSIAEIEELESCRENEIYDMAIDDFATSYVCNADSQMVILTGVKC